MAWSEDTIEMPSLGRPFQLGMLYDCRKDALIPGITLWDPDSLQKDVNIRSQPKTEFEIISSDAMDDKASALNVSASLKASFLGGLIEVGGSAKYLQDTKKSKRQARVTLQYKATTKYEQLTMSHLGIQNVTHPNVFDHGTATHVVTAILYGAQAFFVFDREVSSSESVQEIEGNLKVMVEKAISITGDADIKWDQREKSQAENFSCKFHGDFALKSNPVSFQDAMQLYTTLPKMMGDDREKAVPITVWLYPLTKLDSKAAKMVREISLGLVFDAQKVLEELSEINMRCNDLAKNPVAATFPELKKKIQQFQGLCKQHRQTFQKELAGILPSIRGGGKEEGALVDILRSVKQSPFNSRKLHDFLESKEREINFVNSFLASLTGLEIVSSRNKLEEIVFDLQNKFVVCFTFTSLHNEEPFLASLEHYLHKEGLEEKANSKCKTWFEWKQIYPKTRKAAKSMLDFTRVNKSSGKTCFAVASVADEDDPGASVYLYEDGMLVSNNYELPTKPLPLLVGGITHDRVQLTFQPAEYGKANITNYRVEYRMVGEENWKIVETEDSQETFLLKGLSPNREYQFQYAAKCKPGLSETSDMSKALKTLPTSPPKNLREVAVGSSTISVAWGSPSVIGEGVVIKEYKVEYREESGRGNSESKNQWNEVRTGRKAEFCHLGGLRPQTVHRLRVSAVCADGAQSAPSEEMEASTSLKEEGEVKVRLVQKSTPVLEGQPAVHLLPLEVRSDNSTSHLIYHLGEENLKVPNKVIIMMGAIGSGKTTLINGMVNYILGVQWEDKFRFKLLHKETNRLQAENQTSEVVPYVLNYQEGFQIPYSLTIIDTPRFGSTKGIEDIKSVTEQIWKFFSTPGNIDHIDSVCFVVKAPSAHLTPTERYVFDAVLSIFGKDMKDNIQILVTFADGYIPPVLEAIKAADVPCAKDATGTPAYFKFNNSALFASSAREGAGSFDEMFWKMGETSMKTFFDSLNKLETRPFALTKGVLRGWKELETVIARLRSQMKTDLMKEEKEKCESTPASELRIVLVGNIGNGKSSTGNTILGREHFKFAFRPVGVTDKCEKGEVVIDGRKIVVIDTPGFSHTHATLEEIFKAVKKSLHWCYPGPHAIIQVMQMFRFTEDEKMVARFIQRIFGVKAKDYMITLFTRKDDLEGMPLKACLKERNADLQRHVAWCGGRCLAFENRARGREREEQVAELLRMVDAMVEENRDAPHFTADMLEDHNKWFKWASNF